MGHRSPGPFPPVCMHKAGAPESTGSSPEATQRGARQARPSGLAPPWTGCRWGSPFLQNRVCSKGHRRLLEAAKWDVNQGEPRASSASPAALKAGMSQPARQFQNMGFWDSGNLGGEGAFRSGKLQSCQSSPDRCKPWEGCV